MFKAFSLVNISLLALTYIQSVVTAINLDPCLKPVLELDKKMELESPFKALFNLMVKIMDFIYLFICFVLCPQSAKYSSGG